MNFIRGQLADSRPFRGFVLLNAFTRECLALVPQPRFRRERVRRLLREGLCQIEPLSIP